MIERGNVKFRCKHGHSGNESMCESEMKTKEAIICKCFLAGVETLCLLLLGLCLA